MVLTRKSLLYLNLKAQLNGMSAHLSSAKLRTRAVMIEAYIDTRDLKMPQHPGLIHDSTTTGTQDKTLMIATRNGLRTLPLKRTYDLDPLPTGDHE